MKIHEKRGLLISQIPVLELFHCLPPLFLLSTPVDNSEATWKKATKYNKLLFSLFHREKFKIPAKTIHCVFEFFSFVPSIKQ
jgi:hypothetical protein